MPFDPKKKVCGWTEVAERISRQEGIRITHQALCNTTRRLFKKLKVKLANDPIIREWLIDNGMDLD
jgi:hypothetical protein